jgi:hypothetical protein
MMSNLIELGEQLDSWAIEDRVSVTESAETIIVGRLGSDDAIELAGNCEALGWQYEIHDMENEVLTTAELDQTLAPFIATITKPVTSVALRLITKQGFRNFLTGSKAKGICELAFARTSFASGIAFFTPIGGAELFSPSRPTKSPRDLVRDAGNGNYVAVDIREILPRNNISDQLWKDPAFLVFASFSAPLLLRSVASEVIDSDTIAMAGPPRAVWKLDERSILGLLGDVGFQNLQLAANWIYEDSTTAEQRHSLFAAELAMSASRTETIGHAFRVIGRDILDGAKLAFQLSQSDLIRETIKSQGDLRKSIVDDTTKAADTLRSLLGATAIATATGISLIAARLTSATPPWVLGAVALVVGVYLTIVVFSGWAQLKVQRTLREQWRKRIYRFIPDDDYSAMVTIPTKEAEFPYHLAGISSLFISVCLFGLAIFCLTTTKQLGSEPPASQTLEKPQLNKELTVVDPERTKEGSGQLDKAVKPLPPKQ